MRNSSSQARDIPLATGDVAKLAIVHAESLHTEGNGFSKARYIPLATGDVAKLVIVRAERLRYTASNR
jgi:hypothetical protein